MEPLQDRKVAYCNSMRPTVLYSREFLDLKAVYQKHIDGLWVPSHLSDEQAVQFAMDVNRSRRAMAVILSVPFQLRYNGDDRHLQKKMKKQKMQGDGTDLVVEERGIE